MCGCLLCTAPSTGDLAHNPGMCPDWESNWQPFGSQASTQSTEPHQPELLPSILKMRNLRHREAKQLAHSHPVQDHKAVWLSHPRSGLFPLLSPCYTGSLSLHQCCNYLSAEQVHLSELSLQPPEPLILAFNPWSLEKP